MIVINKETNAKKLDEKSSRKILGCGGSLMMAEKKVLHQGDSFYAAKNVEHGVIALEDSIILDVFTPIREDFLE